MIPMWFQMQAEREQGREFWCGGEPAAWVACLSLGNMALSVTGLFHFYLRDNLSLRIVPAVAVSGCGFPSTRSTFFELCAMFAPNDLTQFLWLVVAHPTVIPSSTPFTVFYPLFPAMKDKQESSDAQSYVWKSPTLSYGEIFLKPVVSRNLNIPVPLMDLLKSSLSGSVVWNSPPDSVKLPSSTKRFESHYMWYIMRWLACNVLLCCVFPFSMHLPTSNVCYWWFQSPIPRCLRSCLMSKFHLFPVCNWCVVAEKMSTCILDL